MGRIAHVGRARFLYDVLEELLAHVAGDVSRDHKLTGVQVRMDVVGDVAVARADLVRHMAASGRIGQWLRRRWMW